MKLRILPSAIQDLRRGQEFYARQGDSLGEYFLNSLFSDIDSLELYAGVHSKAFGYHRMPAIVDAVGSPYSSPREHHP